MTETDQDIDVREDEGFMLPRDLVSEVLRATEEGDGPALEELLEPLHAADIADLFEQIDEDDRTALIALVPTSTPVVMIFLVPTIPPLT